MNGFTIAVERDAPESVWSYLSTAPMHDAAPVSGRGSISGTSGRVGDGMPMWEGRTGG